MKTLKFRPHLVKEILEGRKTATWRLFDNKDLQVGDQVILQNWEAGNDFARAEIINIKEMELGELGAKDKVKEKIQPFLLTVTPINNPMQPCKEHLDIWYRIPTDGSEFNVDPKEFHGTRWMTVDEAIKLVIDPPNVEALDKMEQLFRG